MSFLQKLVASRWIAGTTIEEEIKVVKKLKEKNLNSIINYLGEDINNAEKAKASLDIYLECIKDIKENNLNSQIAIKASQLGLFVNDKVLKKNYEQIIKKAKIEGIFVWLDMERYDTVDKTISLYKKYISYGNTGICIQSYLKRSFKDVKILLELGAAIRIVKGAYTESSTIAHNRDDATKNYIKILNYTFKKSENFTVATHDLSIIKKSVELSKKYKKEPEYAMLYGIRNNIAFKLAKKHKMNLYVPFGKDWFKYSYRRLREFSNLKLVLHSLLENQKLD
ncbi:MAG: proline dehydrogenase family protein [Candidatus Micrarchaeia archaeon]